MMRRTPLSARPVRAVFAWALLLSLVLVWMGAQLRLSDVTTQAPVASLSVLQAADPVATLTTATKTHRPPEFRSAQDPDVADLSSRAGPVTTGDGTELALCGAQTACGGPEHRLPEPRAPPTI